MGADAFFSLFTFLFSLFFVPLQRKTAIVGIAQLVRVSP